MISFHNLHIWEGFHRSARSVNSHCDLKQPRAHRGNLWLAVVEKGTNCMFDSTSVNREIRQIRNQAILGLSYLKFQTETITSTQHILKLICHICCQHDPTKTNCKERPHFLTQTGYRRRKRSPVLAWAFTSRVTDHRWVGPIQFKSLKVLFPTPWSYVNYNFHNYMPSRGSMLSEYCFCDKPNKYKFNIITKIN